MKRALAWMLVVIASSSCGARTAEPRPEWRLVISTDAPIPQFGDRLLVELLNASGEAACPACRRQFGVGASEFPLSFGVVPGGGIARVRVRLFRSVLLDGGSPSGSALIDVLADLPATNELESLEVPLRMACFGVPADLAGHQSCDGSTGTSKKETDLPAAPEPSSLTLPGTWPHAVTKPCVSLAPAGMVCVPGGTFLLGAPDSPGVLADSNEGSLSISAPPTTPEHLTTLSPYFLDLDEMTVGQYDALVAANSSLTMLAPHGTNADHWYCTEGKGDSSLPATCATWAQAAAVCAIQGKRLPTEAEWELAAGNREVESRYPWGDDSTDYCSRLIAGRDDPTYAISGDVSCLSTSVLAPGPVSGGSPGDVTSLGIRNMAGNVAEWTADDFQPYTAPCFQTSNILVDPTCGTPGMLASVRGGDWASVPADARAYRRNAAPTNLFHGQVGIRCAKSSD